MFFGLLWPGLQSKTHNFKNSIYLIEIYFFKSSNELFNSLIKI